MNEFGSFQSRTSVVAEDNHRSGEDARDGWLLGYLAKNFLTVQAYACGATILLAIATVSCVPGSTGVGTSASTSIALTSAPTLTSGQDDVTSGLLPSPNSTNVVATGTPQSEGNGADVPEQHVIYLQYGILDTRIGEVGIPDQLRIEQYPDDVAGIYIVQFDDLIESEWRARLEVLATTRYSYVPNNAYLIRLTESQKEAVSQLEHVQWVGIFQPAYKISPELLDPPEEALDLVILAAPDADVSLLVDQLEALGASVLDSSQSELKMKLRVSIDSKMLPSVASLNDVLWIEPWTQPGLSGSIP